LEISSVANLRFFDDARKAYGFITGFEGGQRVE